MSNMFFGATSFDQDITNWDNSNVIDGPINPSQPNSNNVSEPEPEPEPQPEPEPEPEPQPEPEPEPEPEVEIDENLSLTLEITKNNTTNIFEIRLLDLNNNSDLENFRLLTCQLDFSIASGNNFVYKWKSITYNSNTINWILGNDVLNSDNFRTSNTITAIGSNNDSPSVRYPISIQNASYLILEIIPTSTNSILDINSIIPNVNQIVALDVVTGNSVTFDTT